jgi:hypothetical protein
MAGQGEHKVNGSMIVKWFYLIAIVVTLGVVARHVSPLDKDTLNALVCSFDTTEVMTYIRK